MASLFGKYMVDTCSFTGLQRTYPRDVFPGAWGLFDSLARNGVLLSVEDVLEELLAQDDEAYRWAKKNKTIFLPLDEAIQREARRVRAAHRTVLDLQQR